MGLKERLTGTGLSIMDALRGKDELNHPAEILNHLRQLRAMFPELRVAAAGDYPMVNPAFSRSHLMEIFGIRSARKS